MASIKTVGYTFDGKVKDKLEANTIVNFNVPWYKRLWFRINNIYFVSGRCAVLEPSEYRRLSAALNEEK